MSSPSPGRGTSSSLVLRAYRGLIRIRDKAFSTAIGGAFAAFGPDSVIQLPVRVVGEGRIAIGRGVFIGAGSWLQALPCASGGSPQISVGDGTRIAGYCVLSSASSLTIGRCVLIARNVYISDHNHAYRDFTRPVLDQGIDTVLPVEVGDGAWLGQNTVVTPGVHIGRGAVVGANSVVTTDVPNHCVAVGAPARVVRRFSKQGSTADQVSGT